MSFRRWSKAVGFHRLALVLILPLFAGLSACIVIPVEAGDKEHYKVEKLAFIKIGETTKDEIATRMSDFPIETDDGEVGANFTPQKFRGGDWWLYVQTRKETEWFYLLVSPGGGAIDTIGGVDYRFLLIKFDDNDVVTGYELSSSEGDDCNLHGVCMRDSHYELLAPEDEDRVAKQFHAPANGCEVYVYSETTLFSPKFSLPISLDGQRIGWLLDKKQFFFLHASSGAHQFASIHPDLLIQTQIETVCKAGELMFLELMAKQSGFIRPSYRIEIEQRGATQGQEAVSKRQLTLSGAE